MARGERKHPRPLKFNSYWIEEDNFVRMVKQYWFPFDGNRKGSITIQIAENLKRIKPLAIGGHMRKK